MERGANRTRQTKTSIEALTPVKMRILLFYQAESDAKTADLIWVNAGNFASHVVVLIDGKKARIGSTCIADGHFNRFPFQGEISLLSLQTVSPGKHRLQLLVQSDDRTGENVGQTKYRAFDATLGSNVVEFEVAD